MRSSTAALAATVPAPAIATPSLAVQPDPRHDVLARAQEMLDTLQTSFERKDFHPAFRKKEARRAAQVLEYCRRYAEGADNETLFHDVVLPFFRDYNQSLDWVFRGDPRVLIAHAAKTSRGPQSSDPIFAAIERHRTAYAAWMPLFDVETELPYGTPEQDEAERAAKPYRDAAYKAFWALSEIRPTTAAGIAALMNYILREHSDEFGMDGFTEALAANIASSAERIAGRAS